MTTTAVDDQFRSAPAEWNGEDRPPIGARVEYRGKHDRTWEPCRVVFSSNFYVIVESTGEVDRLIDCAGAQIAIDMLGSMDPLEGVLRPARSAEDKAVEAMASASDFGKCPATLDVCRSAYRAIGDGQVPGVKLDQ